MSYRSVAQPGRALRSGRRSRWSESSHSDQKYRKINDLQDWFLKPPWHIGEVLLLYGGCYYPDIETCKINMLCGKVCHFCVAHQSKIWHKLGTFLEEKSKCAKNHLQTTLQMVICANKNPAFSICYLYSIFCIFTLIFYTKDAIIFIVKL